MADFGALLANPHVWVQWPHVFFAGLATAAFFVLGICRLFRLLRRAQAIRCILSDRSFKVAAIAPLPRVPTIGGDVWWVTPRRSTWCRRSR